MNHYHLKRRILLFIIGTTVNAFGITLITKAYLGTSPISSLPFVLSLKLTPSFGVFTFIFNMLFLLGQVVLQGKSFPKVQFLQIPLTIFFGLVLDLFMYIFRNVKPANYSLSLALLLLGCMVMALGISMAVRADLILTPGNAFVQAVSKRTGKKYGTIEIIFDSTLTIMAAAVSICSFGYFRGVREGTIISAFLVGAFINLYHRLESAAA